MVIIYLLLRTIYLSTNDIPIIRKVLEPDFKRRTDLLTTELVTSNNLDNLCCDNSDVENVKLDNLKLKPNKRGNSLLVPLFEIKNENGEEIDGDIIENSKFNSLELKDKIILLNKNFYRLTIHLNISCGRIFHSCLFMTEAKLLIFKNQKTNIFQLYLYMPLPDCDDLELTFKEQGVFCGKEILKKIRLGISSGLFETSVIDLNAEHRGDNFETHTDITASNSISLALEFESLGVVKLSDSNIFDKYLTIKNMEKITKYGSNKYNNIKKIKNLNSKEERKIYKLPHKQDRFNKKQEPTVVLHSQEQREEEPEKQELHLQETISPKKETQYIKRSSKSVKKDNKMNNSVTSVEEAQISEKNKEKKESKSSKDKRIGRAAGIAIVLLLLIVISLTILHICSRRLKK
ncbi:hypothetical protein CDIK_1594 [Cucumispora dikerogammari]|nr:hypothetical protein CDIK_1594 [Cucumispora dikerogammari]